MKTKLMALALLAGGSMFAATRVSIGVGIGGYAPGYYQPQPAYVAAPPCPGPDYIWSDGRWTRRPVARYEYRSDYRHDRDFDRDRHYDRDRDRDSYRNSYRGR
jgi:hypothetical protein